MESVRSSRRHGRRGGKFVFEIRQRLCGLCLIGKIIVNREDWLGSPANVKGTNKDAKIDVERSTSLHNLCFPLIHYA